MRTLIVIIVVGCLLALSSCTSQSKIVTNYLEDMTDTTSSRPVLAKETIIQKNDLLSIQVYSASAEPEVDALYNLPVLPGGISSQSNQLRGFLVDNQGNIEFPRIGTIYVEGMTKNQLADTIKAQLQGQLTKPSVIIRFLNYRITMLGELGNPGEITVPTEKVTILEAIGMAGGITQYGKKKEVKVLRENNGQRKLGIIDLTSDQMFQSPYYYLQQNDVVMVEQTRYKVLQLEQQRVSQQIGFALSIITSIALLYNIFK